MRLSIAIAALALSAPANASELINNSSFSGPAVTTSVTGLYAVGPAAASGWNLWNSSQGTTTSSLLTTFQGRSNAMKITTDGEYNGIFQYFGSAAQFGSADIWIEQGRAVLIAAADGTVVQESIASTVGSWLHLSLDTGLQAFNEVTLYSFGGSATFYVAAASATSPVPEPATWALLMIGFGGLGYVMRGLKGSVRIRFA